MKRLLLAFFVACQMIVSSAAFAWSPLDGVDSAVKRFQHCYFIAASSEGDQEGEKEAGEEEEEPECD